MKVTQIPDKLSLLDAVGMTVFVLEVDAKGVPLYRFMNELGRTLTGLREPYADRFERRGLLRQKRARALWRRDGGGSFGQTL